MNSEGTRKRPRGESFEIDDTDGQRSKRAASMEKEKEADRLVQMESDRAATPDSNRSQPTAHDDEHEQAPNEAKALPLPTPPLMPRVQSVSTRDKYDTIGKLKYTSQKEGDTWYLISSTWINQWKRLCSPNHYKGDDSSLGPIDNSDLVDDSGVLLPALQEEVKFELFCKEAWDHFVDWYGTPTHPLPRKVISEGVYNTKKIEVYPLKLSVFRMCKLQPAISNATTPVVEISKAAKVQDLLDQIIQISTLEPANLRFWLVMGPKLEENPLVGFFYPSERIVGDEAQPFPSSEEDKSKRLDNALVENGDAIVYEYCSNGVWTVDLEAINISKTASRTAPAEKTSPFFNTEAFKSKYQSPANNAIKPVNGQSYPTTTPASQSNAITTYQGPLSSSYSTNGRYSSHTSQPKDPGTVGLNNLGNTCFMNSALQCLAHGPELTEYFLTGFYREELNPTNPLGMKGAIAEVFGSLLDKLWHPNSYAVAPRDFKQTLQRFAPQFSGYAQHDTQEFLAFLLDGLHEDLNRVLKKPYVEMPDWNGGDEKALVQHAITAWDGYKKRNDSVIVDLFQGQYKSTLVCPECDKVSITFDPFMYLTLPLPVQRSWEHTILFVPYETTKARHKIPVQLSRDGCIKDLKVLMKKWLGVPVENQVCIEVFSHKIYKDLQDHSPLGDIAERDIIVIYELPCSLRAAQGDEHATHVIVPIYHANSSPRTYSTDLFGIPLYLAIPLEKTTSEEEIYAALVERYKPWTDHSDQLYRRVVAFQNPEESSSSESPKERETDEVEEQDVTEMKVEADQDQEMLPESKEPSEVGEEQITTLGPQENLFTIKAYSPNRSGGYSYASGLFIDPLRGIGETLAERATSTKKKSSTITFKWKDTPPTPEPEPPKGKKQLITSEDTLLCEWDANLIEFFFGITPSKGYRKDENSSWDQWELLEHPEYVAASKAKKATKEHGITLNDCLDEFTKEERLGEDDPWYCPQCKKHQQATKKFELWRVPDILVVHLKRFSNSRFLRDKIDAFVDFPIEGLDLEERVEERVVAKNWVAAGKDLEELGITDASTKEPLLYDLCAVDEHLGGLGGGHYRAYARNFSDGTWYHFDDTHVSMSKARDSVNANAYLLFYRRRADKPLGGALHERLREYRERIESGELPDKKAMGGTSGVASKTLEQEYSSSFVHTVSPDHSPPEHNEFYDGIASSSQILPGSGFDENPFGHELLPDFDNASADPLLETSVSRYEQPFWNSSIGRRNSVSSSNDPASPTSSVDHDNNISQWNDGNMDDIPDLKEIDTYNALNQHDNMDEIDSDHLDDEPDYTMASRNPKAATPPLPAPSSKSPTPARETAPSPSSTHEEPKNV